MDTLRNDEEREINHHGKSIQVGDDGGDNIDIIESKRKVFENCPPQYNKYDT